jgi:hypothetical protein
MPCTVKKTFECARDTGNHLLVQLKANQARLFESVRITTADSTPADIDFSRNTGRSRQEDRTVEVFPVGDALATTEWQPFVKTIIRVTRHTLLYCAATGLWKERGEVAYYVSSAGKRMGRRHPRPLEHREPQSLRPRRFVRRRP